jgi:hypothetical protein
MVPSERQDGPREESISLDQGSLVPFFKPMAVADSARWEGWFEISKSDAGNSNRKASFID